MRRRRKLIGDFLFKTCAKFVQLHKFCTSFEQIIIPLSFCKATHSMVCFCLVGQNVYATASPAHGIFQDSQV